MIAKQIHPKVYDIAAPFEGGGLVHCYLIDAPRRTLIDTGTSSVPRNSLLPALKDVGWDPSELRILINTHMHHDHAGGNAEMQEVSGGGIHMHRADYDLADREKHLEKYCRDPLRLMDQHADIPEREAFMRGTLGREWGIERALEDGDVIDLGGDVRLDVVHTPGHTPGSTSFFWASAGIMFSGDAVGGRGSRANGYPLYFSARDYGRSIKRLLEMPIATLAQAHNYRWSAPTQENLRAGADARKTLEESLAVLEDAVRAELKDNPRIAFQDLFWNVVRRTSAALGNDPDPKEIPNGAVASIATHWREATGQA